MSKINLAIDRAVLDKNIQKARENNVIIPTLRQMQDPETIPDVDLSLIHI